MVVVAEAFGMSLGTDAEPLTLASELNSPDAAAAWRGLAKQHQLIQPDLGALCVRSQLGSLSQIISQRRGCACMYDDSLGNSAVFTDVMIGGPAMGDKQAQEGGYNASLQNRAEKAAQRDIAKPDASGLMVVGPLMSSLSLRQVRLSLRIDGSVSAWLHNSKSRASALRNSRLRWALGLCLQNGFTDTISSEKSMEWWLAELQRTQILPR